MDKVDITHREIYDRLLAVEHKVDKRCVMSHSSQVFLGQSTGLHNRSKLIKLIASLVVPTTINNNTTTPTVVP